MKAIIFRGALFAFLSSKGNQRVTKKEKIGSSVEKTCWKERGTSNQTTMQLCKEMRISVCKCKPPSKCYVTVISNQFWKQKNFSWGLTEMKIEQSPLAMVAAKMSALCLTLHSACVLPSYNYYLNTKCMSWVVGGLTGKHVEIETLQ